MGDLLRFDFSTASANTLFTQLRVSGIVVWCLPDVAVFRLDFLISSVLCSSFSPLLLSSADGNRAILEKFWLVEFLFQQFDFSSLSLSLVFVLNAIPILVVQVILARDFDTSSGIAESTYVLLTIDFLWSFT